MFSTEVIERSWVQKMWPSVKMSDLEHYCSRQVFEMPAQSVLSFGITPSEYQHKEEGFRVKLTLAPATR